MPPEPKQTSLPSALSFGLYWGVFDYASSTRREPQFRAYPRFRRGTARHRPGRCFALRLEGRSSYRIDAVKGDRKPALESRLLEMPPKIPPEWCCWTSKSASRKWSFLRLERVKNRLDGRMRFLDSRNPSQFLFLESSYSGRVSRLPSSLRSCDSPRMRLKSSPLA